MNLRGLVVLMAFALVLAPSIDAADAEIAPAPEQASTKCTPSESLPAVVMSRQNICHLLGTELYNRTRDARPFDSMDACVRAGGRPSDSIVFVKDCKAPDLAVEDEGYGGDPRYWVIGTAIVLALLIGAGWYQRLKRPRRTLH